jgi:hypothetical protein
MNDQPFVQVVHHIFRIFQAYSKNLNEFTLDGVVRSFLLYKMVQHISGIFQPSERVHPEPLRFIHPSKYQTMSNLVPFHS